MSDTSPESQRPSIEQLIEGEITRIIELHLTNLKVFHMPSVRTGGVSPEEARRTVEKTQISRIAERIVQEVLIPQLQPDANIKRGEMALKPDVLQYVMLNYGLFQKVFKEAFINILGDDCGGTLVDIHFVLVGYLTLFDREMMVALAGGRPEDPSTQKNAGAELDATVDRFAERVRSFQCPLGKKSLDQ